jgi:carnitine monooxygenase subunit
MDRADLVDTTRRVLKCIAERSLETAPEAMTYSADFFTSRDRLVLERERLFMDLPHVVGFVGEVAAPGQYVTRDVAGIPVLVVHGSDGVLRAFLNACAHRGASVASGSGCSRRFTCGYHAWSYDTQGKLASLPAKKMFEGLDHSLLGLQPLPVTDEAGLIIVGLRPGVEVDGWLDDVAPALRDARLDEAVPITNETVTVKANWKLSVDVNFEGYHFPAAHTNTLHPIATGNASYDVFGRHCRWAFPMRHIEALADQSEESWPDYFIGTIATFFYPSVVLVEAADTLQLLRIYPGAHPGESIVDIAYSVTSAPTDEERANHLMAFEFVKGLLCGEDFPMAEQCQRGMAAGRERIVVGRNEPLLQHLHRVWQDGMQDVPATRVADQLRPASLAEARG